MQDHIHKQRPVLTTITPFLVVDNAARAAEFYTSGLGATELERYEVSNGKLGIKLAIDKAEFYIGDEEPEFGNVCPQTIGGSPMRMILTVADPDTLFAGAITAGATVLCHVATEADWRIGKLKDPFGHTWEIGCQLG